MDQGSGHIDGSAFPGNVLVAGCGFIITGAAWGLFGFLEGDLNATSSAAIFFALAIAHAVVGVAVLRRFRIVLPIGFAVAALGIIVALLKPQFVLVFTNCVIFLLLLLARGDVGRQRVIE